MMAEEFGMCRYEDSIIANQVMAALSNPSAYMVEMVKRQLHSKPISVRHHETCPVCGRTLVNLYRYNDEWKCRKCGEMEVDSDG